MLDRQVALGTVLDALGDAIVVVNMQERIVLTNRAATKLLGFTAEELRGAALDVLLPPRLRTGHHRHVQAFAQAGQSRQIGRRPLLRALTRDGSERPVSITVSSIDLGGERLMLAALRDATHIEALLTRAVEQSETDSLTGMPNRSRLVAGMQQRIDEGRAFGLLFLDLSGFKRFNDELGHLAGDQVLRIVAQRLLSQVRERDLAVRWAGDEFALLLGGPLAPAVVTERARDVAAHLAEPFSLGPRVASVLANVGISRFPEDGASVDGLLAVADRAMYLAKSLGVPVVDAAEAVRAAGGQGGATARADGPT